LLLGAVEMSPLEVAEVYGVFANGGMHRPLTAIQAVVTNDGKRLKAPPRKSRAAADPVAIYQLNRILVAAMTRGTGRAGTARLPSELVTAGKTGTSSDLRDSWFAGFSGSHLAVAWVGHDDNASTGLTGSQGALPIWADVMGGIGQRSWQASLPSRLEEVWIDYATGYVPDPECGSDVIAVAVPRNTLLQHSEYCYPPDLDRFIDRMRDWWQRVTD
jgi:penicillin-binding protein 1B